MQLQGKCLQIIFGSKSPVIYNISYNFIFWSKKHFFALVKSTAENTIYFYSEENTIYFYTVTDRIVRANYTVCGNKNVGTAKNWVTF